MKLSGCSALCHGGGGVLAAVPQKATREKLLHRHTDSTVLNTHPGRTDGRTLVGVHHALQHADRVVRLQLQRGVAHCRHQLAEEVGHLAAVLQQHVAVLPVGEVGVAEVGPARQAWGQRNQKRRKTMKGSKNLRQAQWETSQETFAPIKSDGCHQCQTQLVFGNIIRAVAFNKKVESLRVAAIPPSFHLSSQQEQQ